MTFGSFSSIGWGLVIAVLTVIGLWAIRRKAEALSQWVHPSSWGTLIHGWSVKTARLRLFLWALGAMFLVLAMMQPRYGMSIEKVERKGQDIMLVMDVSKSMSAQDTAPSRLQFAKQASIGLISALKGDRVGLVVFSGSAYTQAPLTLDYGVLSLFLEATQVGMLPQPGSDLATALTTATKALRAKNNKYKAIVLFTDGESFSGDPLSAAKEAAKKGIHIYVVGLGTQAGDPMPEFDASGQQIGYKKDKSGTIVLSKRNDTLLRQIAQESKGLYLTPSDRGSVMETIYQDISKRDKQSLEDTVVKIYKERYAIPLTLALLCLLGCWFVPFRTKEEAS